MQTPEQIRSRYDASGSYQIESRAVRASQLSLRSLNFGQHWRTPGVKNVRYVVELPDAYFLDFLAGELPDFVEDSKRFPDDTDAFENALRRSGWPDPRALRNDPYLAKMTLERWAHDLLLRWFGDGEPSDSPGYVLNTIDGVDFAASRFVVRGQARKAGLAIRYQDV